MKAAAELCKGRRYQEPDAYLALQTLYKMSHCHSGWDGVGIDDNVRCYSLTGKRHVLQHRNKGSAASPGPCCCQPGRRFNGPGLIIDHRSQQVLGKRLPVHLLSVLDATGPFLSMSAGKLVSNLGDADRADLQEMESAQLPACISSSAVQVEGLSAHPDLTELVALLVQRHHHLIHDSSLTGSQEGATVPLGVAPVGALQLIFVLRQRHRLPNDHVLTRHTNTRSD